MSILALILAAQAAHQIESEPVDGYRFRLSISGRINSVEAAQAALMPTARKLCGARPVSFGTFRFAQTQTSDRPGAAMSPATLKVEQELFCGTVRQTVDAAALRAPGWQPSEADQQAVLAATYAYFAARDRGRYPEAWSMLSDSMKQISPVAEWQRVAADFNAAAGAVRGRRVTEITWYNNPPGAPRPGVYVAADYSGEFEQLEFLCGYLMWQVQPDGSFRLTREEQNLLDKATAKNLASIDRQPLRAQMGCKE
jgi:hypothetical protein